MGDADGPQQRMEEDGRMELIHVAIQQLLAQKRNEKKNKKEADDDDDEQLLSRLLLQLESLKKETGGRQCESLVGMKEQSPAAVKVETSRKSEEIDVRKKETKSEEIVKELKQVKRQNTITHWLLTGMMVLIAAWQFSEVKLFLKVKNKVTDPFRSVENMITGAQDTLKHLDGHEQDAAQKNHSAELNSKSALKVPDLLNMDLPVESVKKESAGGQSESLGGMREPSPAAVISLVETNRMSDELDVGKKESESEEIVKELKQVKWQNTVTHWLLTATMVLIAAWQFSEVKLFLKVKNKVTHPFRSVENMITGAHDALKHLDGHEQDAARKNHLAELNSKSAFKVPDLPYMDLPFLGLHGGEREA